MKAKQGIKITTIKQPDPLLKYKVEYLDFSINGDIFTGSRYFETEKEANAFIKHYSFSKRKQITIRALKSNIKWKEKLIKTYRANIKKLKAYK